MSDLSLIYYLPILSTVLTVIFAWRIYQRYLRRGREGNHLLWWTYGVLTFGMGTFAESFITLLGWNPVIFKFWYIVGALLGGAPLAQGTVWLLLRPETARRLTVALVAAVVISASFVIASPLNLALVDPSLPSGRVFEWQWVRAFSPFINTYAVIFLVGGATLSAWRYRGIALGGSMTIIEFQRKKRFPGKPRPLSRDYDRGQYIMRIEIAEIVKSLPA